MKINPLLNTDSYKIGGHYLQYPPGTQYISSYIESRGGAYESTLFFGLQIFLKELKPVKAADVDEAQEYITSHGLPFNRLGFDMLVNKHGGRWPVKIQAVKEGMNIPTHNVLVQVVNTDPEMPWVTSFLETELLRAVWYPTTVASRSKAIKNIIASYMAKTSDDMAGLDFKLHDFGFRGVSSLESGGIGGCAHLVNFKGSDTLAALVYARRIYNETMAGFSIPASEHSTITSWGREKEAAAYRNMLKQFGKPGALFACVSDSYDIYNACSNLWGGSLRDEVIASGAILVVRPDSGDPTVVPVECVKLLDEKFGSVVNGKGYKVLNHVRVIQGDGINEHSIRQILENLTEAGYSTDNIAFGMGGELLQGLTRDTLKFAMKASAIKTKSEFWADVYKDPVGDAGKRSKRGRLGLVFRDGAYQTVPETAANGDNLLETVYLNGRVLRNQSFAEIRELSNK